MNFIGKEIDRYRLVDAIDKGSYGIVYRAHHTLVPERVVALKLLQAYLVDEEKERKKFIQEASFLMTLKHPHILPTYDVGFTSEGEPYLVSEYEPGGSLRRRLRDLKGQLLPLQETMRLLTQIG